MEYRSPAELRLRFKEELRRVEPPKIPRGPATSFPSSVKPGTVSSSSSMTSSSPVGGLTRSSASNAALDDPTALVREVPLAENLEALTAALEQDEAVQRHMETHNLSLEEATGYIMTNGSTGQKLSFFSHMKSNLEDASSKQVRKVISIMLDSMWAQDPELQLHAPHYIVDFLSAVDPVIASEIYDVTTTMLTVQTAQVREAWSTLLLALVKHLSADELQNQVIPLAIKKTEHAMHQDQRELSCHLLGTLCKHIPRHLVESTIVPKALALCQDTNASVRKHICVELGVIARSLGIEAAESTVAPEIFELLNDEEHGVSCQAFSCLLDLVEFFGSEYRKEKLLPIIKSYMLNPPTEVLALLVGDFGRFLNEIKSDITSNSDVLLFTKFFVTASQKLDDTAKWHCAYNFPAVAACLPLSVFPTHLSACLLSLASNPEESVRLSIAAGLHELVSILGDNAATFLEKPFLVLVNDVSRKVRAALHEHKDLLLNCFIKLFKGIHKINFLRHVADRLLELFGAGKSSWRAIEEALSMLDPYLEHFEEVILTDSVVPQLFECMKVGASSLKGKCARLLIRILHRITNTNQQVVIFRRVNGELGRSSCCFHRQAYIQVMIEACQLHSCRFIRERFLDICQQLHRDPVLLVRLAVSQGMGPLGKVIVLAGDDAMRETFTSMSQRLLMDEDTVIRTTMRSAKDKVDKLEGKYSRDPALRESDLEEDRRREIAELQMLEAAKEADKVERRAKLRDLLKSEREKDFMDHSIGLSPSLRGAGSGTGGGGSSGRGINPRGRMVSPQRSPLWAVKKPPVAAKTVKVAGIKKKI